MKNNFSFLVCAVIAIVITMQTSFCLTQHDIEQLKLEMEKTKQELSDFRKELGLEGDYVLMESRTFENMAKLFQLYAEP